MSVGEFLLNMSYSEQVSYMQMHFYAIIPELVQRINTGGRTPRCLAMSDCGEFLLVAHQHSHDVASFRRDSDSGTLSFINRLEANCAACVKFVKPELIRR